MSWSATPTMTCATYPHPSKASSDGRSARLNGRRDPLLIDVLGLLATARKPLGLRELGQITGTPQREIHQTGIRPIRQFLLDLDEGYSFYHARFHEFVTHELLYEDELPRYHATLASWLRRPECRSSDYRYLALAYHLDRGRRP